MTRLQEAGGKLQTTSNIISPQKKKKKDIKTLFSILTLHVCLCLREYQKLQCHHQWLCPIQELQF